MDSSNPKWMTGTLVVVLLCIVSIVRAAHLEHLVKDLPGLPPVHYQQYAGYVTVDESHARNQFYWFVTADDDDATSLPLALWFNGGPGCSSVGNGMLSELGPFYVVRDESGNIKLDINHYSWNREANIIFVESPVGVGFSYSDTPSDYSSFTDKRTAEDNLQFILGWLELFPEYKSNEFYLLGESYAGHYIPTLVKEILDYNENRVPSDMFINFKGFAVGNPWTDAYINNFGATHWWRYHSLISAENFNAIIENCELNADSPIDYGDDNKTCNEAVDKADNDMRYIDAYSIFTPYCNKPSSNHTTYRYPFQKLAGFLRAGSASDPCTPDAVKPFLNLLEVKNALHVRSDIRWSGCSNMVNNNYSTIDIRNSMLPLYRDFATKKLKMWIYSGDTDSVCPTSTSELTIQALNFTVSIPWYPWNHSNQVGGYTEVYEELTYTTVRNAGHFVPYSQPGRALALFKHFLKGTPLPAFK